MNIDLSSSEYEYILERSNSKVQVWCSADKSQALFNSFNTEADINLTSSTLWVEAIDIGDFYLKLVCRNRFSGQYIFQKQVNFNSIIVTFEIC